MGGAPFIGYSGGGGRSGGGFGGLVLPLILLAGGGMAIWYFGFGPGKGQIVGGGSGIGNTIGNSVNGIWTTMRDYSIYILITGILIQLLYGKVFKGTGAVGGFIALASWIMIIGGGLITWTNFSGIKLPGVGAQLRQLTGSNYAMPVTGRPIPTIMPRQYRPVKGRIITGTQQNGPTNPAYDKNTPFSLIGDVY